MPVNNIKNIFILLDFHLTDNLKAAIIEAKKQYQNLYKALDIDYLIFKDIGKNMCKKQNVSPDAIMQLGFQVFFLFTIFLTRFPLTSFVKYDLHNTVFDFYEFLTSKKSYFLKFYFLSLYSEISEGN